MAIGPLRPGGKRCAPPFWTASGPPKERPARVASTTPSWASGVWCAGGDFTFTGYDVDLDVVERLTTGT
eukprot:728115-Alexandrium_andersonii.AAC.1